MLRIWIGRANTGKSGRVLAEIARAGDAGQQILLVPEHATYQAELDLCRACGDGASRHAEVLSFRRLAHRVLSVTGGLADCALDQGGRLLLMRRAVQEVGPSLTVFQRYAAREGFLSGLTDLYRELTAYQVPPERLLEAGAALQGGGGDRLRDLSLIFAAYRRLLETGEGDRREELEKLADHLAESGYADGKDVFLDGFSYFTAQEERLIAILLGRARSVTVTVLGDRRSAQDAFAPGRRTCLRLEELAARSGSPCVVEDMTAPAPADPIAHLEAHFLGDTVPWAGDASQVELYRADSPYAEVEYVASRILALVRSGTCRFRDIAVTARNLEDYEPAIESVFARYGVPVYLSRRSDILEKPVLSLIAGVLDSILRGYEYEDMFRWLKTGLAGLTDGECDKLENYVILWDVRGAMWLRDQDWTANPAGWQEGFTGEQTEALAEINGLRRRVREPLSRLVASLGERARVRGKLEALTEFLEEIRLPEQLRAHTARLRELGRLQQAQEYGQLWEVLCTVLDQCAALLGDVEMGTEEFARLIKLELTQYDVGTIPVSLDQVQIASMTRNDRHRVKCLFLMGANDHVLPAPPAAGGLLSREDRERLRELGVELAPDGDRQLELEMLSIYAALVQPTDRLVVSWPAADDAGGELRPAFVVERLRRLLPGLRETAEAPGRRYRLTAPAPALEMAGQDRGGALWNYFAGDGRYASVLSAMDRAASMGRGRLSPQAVEALYGRTYRMSASRVDRLNSCHFAYFMEYGLRARERAPAGFDAAQVGTFLHYVLEHVVRRATDLGGFAQVSRETLEELIRQVIQEYMDQAMPGFDGRDARFRYLFRRLRGTVTAIVENVAQELAASDFKPMAFELEFGGGEGLPAITIQAGDASLSVVGKVDRVDGWLKDGRLYIRVVDYKSGKKSFDLSDVRMGLNLQMLLYLFTLEREGAAVFGGEHPIVPAGVMYLPARDVLLTMDRNTDPAVVRSAMDKELRRSGLVLGEPEVLHAMEHSDLAETRFLPVSLGRGGIPGGLATAEQLGKLSRYVERLLERVARELRQGNIDADPCGHGEQDSVCAWCEFASACHFTDGEDGEHMKLIRPVRPEEFWRQVDETIGEEEDPCPSN